MTERLLIARKEFATTPEYEKFDWMKSYPDMDINVSVEVTFGEFGRQAELPSLEEVRDKIENNHMDCDDTPFHLYCRLLNHPLEKSE